MKKKDSNSKNVYFLFSYIPLGVPLLLMVLFFNCAFLNTLYNAKIAFNISYKSHLKHKRLNPDSSHIIPEEILKGYDRAINKSMKVIDVYPKRKRWHDDAMFLKAKATFYKDDVSNAIHRLVQLQQSYPKSPFIPESYLLLGKAYLQNKDLQKAEEAFQYILDTYPDLNKKEEITFLIAEVAIQREGKSQAIKILEQSLSLVKSDVKKMEIAIKLSSLYYDLTLYKKVIQTISSSPRNKKYPHILFQMDYYLLLCYKQQSDFNQAISLVNTMLKNNNYIIYEPKILLLKGMILKNINLIEDAIDVFERINAGHGSSDIKGESWFELGFIYQFNFKDYEKAKNCYEKVIALSSDKKLLHIANERIIGFDKVNIYQKYLDGLTTSEIDTLDTTETPITVRYKLGETYWLNLSEADSALSEYTIIAKDSLADSNIVLKSMYASAWILRFIKKDTLRADSIYKEIIRNHPTSITAQKSQQDIGEPITIKTRRDSARVAYITAERKYFEGNNPIAAVNAYNTVSIIFSDIDDIAASSIYAAAWLCDNVLNKNKTALKLYKRLCNSYPDSDLCLNVVTPKLHIVEDTLRVLQSNNQNSLKSTKNKNSNISTLPKQPVKTDFIREDELHENENLTSEGDTLKN